MNKNIEIKINFETLHPNSVIKNLSGIGDKYYKNVGLKRGLIYCISGDELTTGEYFYFVTDYIARICWAFNTQKQINFLINYKRSFLDYKIKKIDRSVAIDQILQFEKESPLKSHGLLDLFSFALSITNPDTVPLNNALRFWCDNLNIEKRKECKGKITVKYFINPDNSIRGIMNPIKSGIIFNRLQYIEHIESLNLIIGLGVDRFHNNKELLNEFFKAIDFAFEYFIKNPSLLTTVQQSNEEVYKIILNKLYEKNL